MLEGTKTLVREGFLGMRLIWKLPSFLKKTIEPSQAKAIIKQRVERRCGDFLLIIKKCIYDQPKSPYLRLLQNAGCEYGDIQNLVAETGVEGALHTLYRNGVYFTSKELRGECETVRGNVRFIMSHQKIQNPFAKRHIPVRSSGSRSRGTHIVRSLDYASDNVLQWIVSADAHNIFSTEKAVWMVPGGITLNLLIKLSLFGPPPVRWFSQLDPHSQVLSFRYRLSSRLLGFSGRLAGVPMPGPEFVSVEDPLPVIDWIKDQIERGRTAHLYTLASSAVRLAQRAVEAGIDLRGAYFTISGEPVTKARLETIKCSGTVVTPAMGCVETGSIGIGCLLPAAPDDLHLAKDLHAVIQPGNSVNRTDLRSQSLLFSSLRLSSPLVLLNVSVGDLATLEQRSCGCPLGDLGLDTHLYNIRSFEKLTSGGMAFQDSEVIRILEEELPERFGGGPTDYQFLEEENENGTPQLRLYVHPALGPLDENKIKKAFLEIIGKGSGADKITALLWEGGDMLTVERAAPKKTATGKIQHLHIDRGR